MVRARLIFEEYFHRQLAIAERSQRGISADYVEGGPG
jgi:hypothetical protein